MSSISSFQRLFGLHEDFKQTPLNLSPKTFGAFKLFQNKAKDQGIDLYVASGFRSFSRQASIWNAKAKGERDLIDDFGAKLDFNELSPTQVLFSILRWSALPGFSRHHWGSDFDVIDQKALAQNPNYKVELIPSEYEAKGIFENLGAFLSREISESPFFRPYEIDRGGVAIEPWHLSYAPEANLLSHELTYEKAKDFIMSAHYQEILLNETVLEHFDEIYERFIRPL